MKKLRPGHHGQPGRGALKSLFMGSVSSHLASNVKCPILIIK
ncbi:MAG: universal stress protein [Dialister invisus]